VKGIPNFLMLNLVVETEVCKVNNLLAGTASVIQISLILSRLPL
jgi:hypothetical protein